MPIPRFIHFFGPDGSGKSTQVKLLVRKLKSRGIRVRKCWVRSPHTLAFILWKFLVKIGFYRSVLNPFGIAVKFPAVNRSRALKLFWSTIEFFSVLPLILRVRILMLRGYTLVAERYIFDTITTIAYFLDDRTFVRSMVSRMLLRFIPKGTAFIFLDADFETIYRRRAILAQTRATSRRRFFNYGALPAAFLEPRHFIDFQRKIYAIFASSYNALIIDTSQNSVEETSKRIRTYLNIE
jgi:hypothetical protein